MAEFLEFLSWASWGGFVCTAILIVLIPIETFAIYRHTSPNIYKY